VSAVLYNPLDENTVETAPSIRWHIHYGSCPGLCLSSSAGHPGLAVERFAADVSLHRFDPGSRERRNALDWLDRRVWGAARGNAECFVIALTTTIYFFSLIVKAGRADFWPYAMAGIVSIIMSALTFLWSRRLPLKDSRPTPRLVLFSFGIFIISLILAAGALLLRRPIFPWTLTPESSIVFGCIFLGDAFYFLHALLYPRWHNAAGQLLSFLAYDLVLILPFLRLFETIKPEFRLSLTVYVLVLLYSGLLAIYYLFINKGTRILGKQ